MVNSKIAIAYIPVLHKGYLAYLHNLQEKGVEQLFLVSDEILALHNELDYIHRKDRIRAIPHEVMKKILHECTHLEIESLTLTKIQKLHGNKLHIYTPREDINEFLIETYFFGHTVDFQDVFLRWNKDNLGEKTIPSGEVVILADFEKEVLAKVTTEAVKSADWWRQVGAALIKGEKILALAHNEHMNEEELPNILGDTRSLFKKGTNINYVTAIHAEASVIAQAAKQGISTNDTTLITTDFPCPYCARLLVKSGVKKIYYMKGYDVLGGSEFFKEVGIEVFRVDQEE